MGKRLFGILLVIALVISFLSFNVFSVEQVHAATILNFQVVNSSDDAWCYWNGSAWVMKLLTDGSQGVGWYSSAYAKQGGGMRFTGVTIPSGAEITSAYLTLRCNYARSQTTVSTKIIGEQNNNAATFSTIANYTARTRTSSYVSWNSIPAWTANVDYNSPDISSVIQELVNDYNGLSSANIVIFWDDHDDNSTHTVTDTCRYGYSYDMSSTYAPKLHIEYIPTITISPTTKAFNTVVIGNTSNTSINFFLVTNNCSVAIDITIQGSDFAGGDDTWTLSDNATVGDNIYGLMVGLDDADDNFDIIVKRSVAVILISNLAASANQSWGLKLYMPSAITGYDNQTMTATLTLVVSAH
jgi:hypothetical protein